MQAAILAGGLGTRIRSLYPDIPKAMIPVGGIPFLEFQMNSLHRAGVNSFVLCIGYKAEIIIEYFTGKKLPYEVHFSIENTQLGTGGAIGNALPKMENQFLLINGDTFVSFELDKLQRFHKDRESLLTLLLVKREDTTDYGTVSVDATWRVVGFSEKGITKGPAYVSAGVYLVDKQIFYFQPEKFSLERDLMPNLVRDNRVFGHAIGGTFFDIGTPDRFSYFKRQIEK